MNWTVYLSILGVMAAVIIVLIIYRKNIADAEDDSLHVQEAETGALAHQAVIAKKLEVVDRWGKLVTVLAILYGLFLAGLYVYNLWNESATIVK